MDQKVSCLYKIILPQLPPALCIIIAIFLFCFFVRAFGCSNDDGHICDHSLQQTMFPLTLAAAVSTMLITSTPVRAADTDSRIESSAAASYTFKTTLKDDSIKVDSKDGAVTLTGTVAAASDNSLAKDTVASLPGVQSVDNQLVVSGAQPAEHSDAWITMKVKTALLFHRNVSATGTSVNTAIGGGCW